MLFPFKFLHLLWNRNKFYVKNSITFFTFIFEFVSFSDLLLSEMFANLILYKSCPILLFKNSISSLLNKSYNVSGEFFYFCLNFEMIFRFHFLNLFEMKWSLWKNFLRSFPFVHKRRTIFFGVQCRIISSKTVNNASNFSHLNCYVGFSKISSYMQLANTSHSFLWTFLFLWSTCCEFP